MFSLKVILIGLTLIAYGHCNFTDFVNIDEILNETLSEFPMVNDQTMSDNGILRFLLFLKMKTETQKKIKICFMNNENKFTCKLEFK